MIEVISSGIYSSIQDQGRFGFRNIGVPLGGVMDSSSANLANALLNNNQQCAVLESTFVGPTLKFHQDAFIAITGANCLFKINDKVISLNAVNQIKQGDVLTIGKATDGIRSYLAVAGGFRTETVLNSRSYFKGITQQQTLKKGQLIKLPGSETTIINRSTIKPINNYIHNNPQTIAVTKGPEFGLLSDKLQAILLTKLFKISSQSNRMAYQLEPKSSLKTNDIITSSVQPGTVQLTPCGQLIILMRDCQTTGGYSRVLQLTEKAINRLAQKHPAEQIHFKFK